MRILISLFSGSCQKLQGSLNILWHILTHEINLAQPVLCKLITLTGRPFQVFQSFGDILRNILPP